MRVFVGFNLTTADFPSPLVVLINPRCASRVGERGSDRCDKPATVRVTYGRSWSLPWCPECAEAFKR